MDYCAIQQLLKVSSTSRNVFNTLFHCHKIDRYLEQHHIIEIISELMIRAGVDQPGEDVVEYLIRNLTEISQKYVRTVVHLDFHISSKDRMMMMQKLSTQLSIPLIECVNNELNPAELHKRLDKFLKRNFLHTKRLIICDFKETDKKEKSLKIVPTTPQGCHLKPQHAIDIQLLDEDFFNQHRINYLYRNICNLKPERLIKGNWSCRVLIIGRMGAGQKTQGALLAKEFGLCLIDLDYLAVQYQQRPSGSDKHKLGFWGFLQESLLKPSCLRNGYVIVCGILEKEDAKVLMEKFIFQPNRIIFIHTSEMLCRRRMTTKGIFSDNDKQGDDENALLNYQMNLYNLHKRELVEYLASTGNEVLHIDGNKSVHEIKTLILANLVH